MRPQHMLVPGVLSGISYTGELMSQKEAVLRRIRWMKGLSCLAKHKKK
jgi:hypothetical protein